MKFKEFLTDPLHESDLSGLVKLKKSSTDFTTLKGVLSVSMPSDWVVAIDSNKKAQLLSKQLLDIIKQTKVD